MTKITAIKTSSKGTFSRKPDLLAQCIIRCGGDVNAGQLLYRIEHRFRKKQNLTPREGRDWIAQGAVPWCSETGLSLKRYKNAIRRLKELGLIEVRTWFYSPASKARVTFIRLLSDTNTPAPNPKGAKPLGSVETELLNPKGTKLFGPKRSMKGNTQIHLPSEGVEIKEEETSKGSFSAGAVKKIQVKVSAKSIGGKGIGKNGDDYPDAGSAVQSPDIMSATYPSPEPAVCPSTSAQPNTLLPVPTEVEIAWREAMDAQYPDKTVTTIPPKHLDRVLEEFGDDTIPLLITAVGHWPDYLAYLQQEKGLFNRKRHPRLTLFG